MARTTTSKVQQVGQVYYKTAVTTNNDGSLSSTTFRTDAKGNNPVSVQTTSVDKNGNRTTSFGTGATAAEQTAFNNPNSPESKARKQQVQSQNPYGPNPNSEQKKQTNLVGGGSGNTATGNGSGGDATSADKKNENASDPQAADVLAASGTATGRKKFPNLRYPLTLEDSKQDKIKFEMLEYKPSTFARETLGFQRPSVNRKPIGRVYLPIPTGISDTNNCNWGSDGEMNAAQIAGAKIALGGITGGGEGFKKEIEGVVSSVLKDSGADAKTAVANLIAGDAVGAGGGLLKRVTGGVLNPNLELLFGGPGLRQFGFTFKMSARSEDEAKQIIGILRFFKQGMSPQKSTTNLFVKAPHTFRITYLHKNNPHKFLNEFKECALTSLTTNYTPEGQYATFYDGVMVSYEMQMQFQELDPVFNEDYTKGTGSSGPDIKIGF